MDGYSLWENDAIEALTEFIDSELSFSSLKQFLSQLSLNTYAEIHAPNSATKLVLVYGNPDIILSSDEIEYLQHSETAIMCDIETGFRIIALTIDCYEYEYQLIASAIIKIFNLMFEGNNLFVFKAGKKISLGCKRDFDNEIANNFCLTDFIDLEECCTIVNILGNIYCNAADIVPEIITNSSLEKYTSDYDKLRFDVNYVTFLCEVEAIFKIDLTVKKARYIQYLEFDTAPHETYKNLSQVLKYIAEPNEIVSSYEALDAAELAAEKIAQKQQALFIPIEELEQEYTDTNFELSESAFENAEIMLNLLLERDAVPETEIETDIDKILKENL